MGMILRQGFSYWKQNNVILTCQSFRSRIKDLAQRALTGSVLNTQLGFAFKRAMRYEVMSFSKQLSQEKDRIEASLIKNKEDALRQGSACQALAARQAIGCHLNAKYEGCRLRAKWRAMGQERCTIHQMIRRGRD